MKYFDPKRKEFTPYGFTCEQWEPRLMSRPDKHAEIELNFFTEGKLTYLFWGERITIEGGKLALFWAATPHQIVDFEGMESYFVITLPLPWVLGLGLPERITSLVLNGQLIQEVEPLTAYDKILFEHWFRDINQDSTATYEIVLLELRARLLRLAMNIEKSAAHVKLMDAGQSSRPSGSYNFSKIDSLAKFIAQNYTNQIGLSDIAQSVGLHPDYAAQIFRKTFGITLNNFVIQHRVQHAQRLLVTSNKKVLDIAFECGFNSLSRFNASFKKLCGCTPREYRSAHRL